MRRIVKLISLLFLAASFTAVLVDCSVIGPSSYHLSSFENCIEVSGHFENSHFHGPEDHVIICASGLKTFNSALTIGMVHPATTDISNNYISTVWQPPRLF